MSLRDLNNVATAAGGMVWTYLFLVLLDIFRFQLNTGRRSTKSHDANVQGNASIGGVRNKVILSGRLDRRGWGGEVVLNVSFSTKFKVDNDIDVSMTLSEIRSSSNVIAINGLGTRKDSFAYDITRTFVIP